LRPVVGDDGTRHPEPVDDVGEERHCLLHPEICDWVHLNPLGEFIDGDQQVGVAPGRLSQGLDNVQLP
jgi:diadenosine tetraphosphatase ApaH/serine/threonine PP2A family protein phosphatase